MENIVRVLNERDRRTLAWLRASVGDDAIEQAAHDLGSSKPYLSEICLRLGVQAPRFTATARPTPSPVGEKSLAAIRHILGQRNSAGTASFFPGAGRRA
jgi:hypothetical protein